MRKLPPFVRSDQEIQPTKSAQIREKNLLEISEIAQKTQQDAYQNMDPVYGTNYPWHCRKLKIIGHLNKYLKLIFF